MVIINACLEFDIFNYETKEEPLFFSENNVSKDQRCCSHVCLFFLQPLTFSTVKFYEPLIPEKIICISFIN